MDPALPVRVTVHLIKCATFPKRPDLEVPVADSDRQHAAEMPLRPQRAAFLTTRKLLRELLAAQLGCPPKAVPIIRQSDGRLRLDGGGFEFSISHCNGWSAVALSADCEVGVDVEPIRPLAGMGDVVTEFFPPLAQAALAASAPHCQTSEFFLWWTRIEAAVKASGRRLDDASSCFDGVVYESCHAVPGLAVAVAAHSEGPLTVDWHLFRGRDDATRLRSSR